MAEVKKPNLGAFPGGGISRGTSVPPIQIIPTNSLPSTPSISLSCSLSAKASVHDVRICHSARRGSNSYIPQTPSGRFFSFAHDQHFNMANFVRLFLFSTL